MTDLIIPGRGSFRSYIPEALRRAFAHFTPKDPQTIREEFELDVLERLIAMRANAFGVPVVGVAATSDGAVKAMLEGFDLEGRWRKLSLRMTFTLLHQRKWIGDPMAVSEAIYQLLCSHDCASKMPKSSLVGGAT